MIGVGLHNMLCLCLDLFQSRHYFQHIISLVNFTLVWFENPQIPAATSMAKRMSRKKKNCTKTEKRSSQLIVCCCARSAACRLCACVSMQGQLSVAKPCCHRPLLWRDLVQEDYGLMSQDRESKHRESKYAFVALRQF